MLSNTGHWIDQSLISGHLFEIRKYPPLTREEEANVVAKMKTGDERAKDLLILSNMRFVITIAKRYQNQGISLNDLISEGNVGLVRAAEKYDSDRFQVRFLSYAVWWIKQSIRESLQKHARVVHIPSNVLTDAKKSNQEPLGETQHDTSVYIPKMVSFDLTIDDDGTTLHEVVRDESLGAPDTDINNPQVNIKSSLGSLMLCLGENEQFVVTKYFGLDGEPWSLQDIADYLLLTKERVRQIKEKALKKLRNKAGNMLELLN